MKGVMFNAFFSIVDESYGPQVTEKIISDAVLSNNGAYTGVGSYDVDDMKRLVKCLHIETGNSTSQLLKNFGQKLLINFRSTHQTYFDGCNDAFDFLQSIEAQIHIDVLKLYPDAELPSVKTSIQGKHSLTLVYQSRRRMADLAEGLIVGVIDFFREDIELIRTDLPESGDQQCVQFDLHRR